MRRVWSGLLVGLAAWVGVAAGLAAASATAEAAEGGRPVGTCIYFLLKASERSHWHRVDAVEIWHFHAGAALILKVAESKAGPAREMRLGPDIAAGERPQGIVPAHHWQAARTTGDWTLVGCTVAPGFQFEGFELAPKGWEPS